MTDKALAARLREHAKPLRRSGQMTHDHIADDLDTAADLIDQMLAYGRDCERAAYERAAQQCEIVRHNSPLDLTYQEGCSDCANAIHALGKRT